MNKNEMVALETYSKAEVIVSSHAIGFFIFDQIDCGERLVCLRNFDASRQRKKVLHPSRAKRKARTVAEVGRKSCLVTPDLSSM